MAENLVIVESPAKAKTIQRYLGEGYEVLASYGHIRDLPRSDFAVEVHDGQGCELTYEVPEKSKKHVTALKKAAKGATVWLAPDLDREGEAIAWHIAEVLDLDVAADQPRDLRRDHQGRDPRGVRQPAPPQPRPGRRPAGPPRRRPHRRLPAVAGAVAHRRVGHLGGAGAVGRPAADRRPRGRDPRVRAPGVLELPRRPAARGGRRGRARGQAVQRGRQEAGHAEGPRQARGRRRQARRAAAGRQRGPRRVAEGPCSRPRLHRGRGPPHRGQAQPQAAVHHLDAAAGRRQPAELLRPPDHVDRPAAVRGCAARVRGRGRPDHVHAHRLGEPVEHRARRDHERGHRALRRPLHPRVAPPVHLEGQGCPGGPRGHPPDLGRPPPRGGAPVPVLRAVPPVRPHLEAHHGDPDGAGGLRPRQRGRRRDRVPATTTSASSCSA